MQWRMASQQAILLNARPIFTKSKSLTKRKQYAYCYSFRGQSGVNDTQKENRQKEKTHSTSCGFSHSNIVQNLHLVVGFVCVCVRVSVNNSHHHQLLFFLLFFVVLFSLTQHFSLPAAQRPLCILTVRIHNNIMTFANHLLIIDVQKMDGISIEPMDGAMKCFKALFVCLCKACQWASACVYVRVFRSVCVYVFVRIFFLSLRYHALDICYVYNLSKNFLSQHAHSVAMVKLNFRKNRYAKEKKWEKITRYEIETYKKKAIKKDVEKSLSTCKREKKKPTR